MKEKNQLNNSLPNFVVIGAAKAGTTSLYQYLNEHPEIFLPSGYKESRFFASEMIQNTLHYKNTSIFTYSKFKELYEGAKDEKAIGDFGNIYLQFPELAIHNIKAYLGRETKIVAILRDPTERAFSAYKFACRNQHEAVSFKYALENEYDRVEQYGFPPDIFHYKDHGLYHNKIKPFIDQFDNVKILFFDDLQNKTHDTMKDLMEFLGVSKDENINLDEVYNEGSWVPANVKLFNSLFTGKSTANKLKPYLEKVPPLFYIGQKTLESIEFLRDKLIIKKEISLDPTLEKELRSFFQSDIENLESLLDVDLSRWKNQS